MNSEICEAKEEEIKQSKLFFDNVKSYYILKGIFDNIKKKRTLEIVKINKKLQTRLDLSINSYKKYCQLFSSIEIDLKIDDNKYNKFINISQKKREYFHIYFDDSDEEIKRNFLKKYENVKKIKIIIDYQVKSFFELFAECKCISSIFFKKFYRTNITNMSGMFLECISLQLINFSNFNTDNVKSMNGMFHKCLLLNKLNVSNFNTSNVTNMYGMFSSCYSLEELNLSNFKTDKVTNMSLMFHECSSLTKLDIFNFNTDNVTNMRGMFAECSSLKELNISNFNIDNVKVTNMKFMFQKCSDELIEKIKKQNEGMIFKMISSFLFN